MKRTEIVSSLKKMYDKGLLSQVSNDGPTSIFVAIKGKNRIIVLRLTESGDSIIAIVGRFFKRQYYIPLSELISLL